ncbi:MAG: 3-isopropylmalate dehydratase small subunit [Beijerinckiaceae bacterium]|jgi:3-isopropylmalate/(R)-2-methylmalate dehydratase small subunit
MHNTIFEPFKRLTSQLVVINQEDIDTDQILPARFMTTTSRFGLGAALFFDWRFDEAGRAKQDHVLNQIDPATHRILLAGQNFGSGSSREHAPWALTDFGFRIILSTAIADIFNNNATRNGLLPIIISQGLYRSLLPLANQSITVDLEKCRLIVPSLALEYEFEIDRFARQCLLEGSDPLEWMMGFNAGVDAYEGYTKIVRPEPITDDVALTPTKAVLCRLPKTSLCSFHTRACRDQLKHR